MIWAASARFLVCCGLGMLRLDAQLWRDDDDDDDDVDDVVSG